MTRRIFTTSTLLLAISISAFAQAPSIDGKWTAQIAGRGGGPATERIYTFKQTGMTFTGSYVGGQGNEVALTNGKIAADGTIEFTMMGGGRGGAAPMEIKYTGKVVGDKLDFAPPAPPAGAEPGRGGRGGGPVSATRVK
jgi:hypothetical protein